MKHPLARIVSGIAIIVGAALSTAAIAGDHGTKARLQADITDVADASVPFDTRAPAPDAADLGCASKSDRPVPVFVPTDQLFSALPATAADSLPKPGNED